MINIKYKHSKERALQALKKRVYLVRSLEQFKIVVYNNLNVSLL